MATEKLTIPLTASQDRHGKKYYIGRLQFPGDIDMREGAMFWIFVSEEGNEELQIGCMDPEKERRKRSSDDPREPDLNEMKEVHYRNRY